MGMRYAIQTVKRSKNVMINIRYPRRRGATAIMRLIACRQKIQKENDEINNRNAFIYKCQKAFPDRPQGHSTRASNPNPSGRAKETEDNPAAKNSKNAVNSTRTDVDVGAANHARQKNFRGGGALAQAHAALRTAAAEFDSDQCGASLKGLCCNRDGPFVRRGPSFMKYSKDFKAARLGGLFLLHLRRIQKCAGCAGGEASLSAARPATF